MIFNKNISFMLFLCFIFVFSCSSKSDSNNHTQQSIVTQKYMKNEPDGFRGLKWGDPLSKLKGKNLPPVYDGSEVLSYINFLGVYGKALNSTVKGGFLTSIWDYPILKNIEKFHKKKDDNNLGGLKISSQSTSEYPIDVYYYFYKKKFFSALVKIDLNETNFGKDINKLLNVISDRYGPWTDEYITKEEEIQNNFTKKYNLGYILFMRDVNSKGEIIRRIPNPTYIWEGKKSLVIQRNNDIIWLNKDIQNKIIRDAKERIEKYTQKEVEDREKGKGKGF
jgi:hypothetical protein